MLSRRDSTLVIALRQFRSLRNEKTILFAVLIQLLVAMFSSFFVVGIVTLYDSSAENAATRSIEIGLSGERAFELQQTAVETGSVQTTVYESRETAVEEFQSGQVNAVIHTTVTPSNVVEATIIAPEEGFLSTFSIVRAQNILENYEQSRRIELSQNLDDVKTIQIEGSVSGSPPFTSFIYTVLIPLLVFLPAFISGAIVIDSVIEDEKIGMLEMLRTTPATENEIIRGKVLTPLLLGPAQISVWILLLWLNGIPYENPLSLIAIGAGITAISVGCGLAVSQFFDERGVAQFAYSSVLVLFLSLSTILPELPTTTIARMGMRSSDQVTVLLTVGYLLIGFVVLVLTVRLYNMKEH